MTVRTVAALGTWAVALAAGWLAWLWTVLGTPALLGLAAAAWLTLARRRRRAPHRPGLPPPHARHAGAAWCLTGVALATLVGYRQDWLVSTALIAAWALRALDRETGPAPPT